MTQARVLLALDDPADRDRVIAAAGYLGAFEFVPLPRSEVAAAATDRELAQALVIDVTRDEGQGDPVLEAVRRDNPRLPILGVGGSGARSQDRALRTDYELEAILPVPLEPLEVLTRLQRLAKTL